MLTRRHDDLHSTSSWTTLHLLAHSTRLARHVRLPAACVPLCSRGGTSRSTAECSREFFWQPRPGTSATAVQIFAHTRRPLGVLSWHGSSAICHRTVGVGAVYVALWWPVGFGDGCYPARVSLPRRLPQASCRLSRRDGGCFSGSARRDASSPLGRSLRRFPRSLVCA